MKAIPYKPLIAALIAGSLTTPAMAGTSVAAGAEAKSAETKPLVTIYGILDVGVEHVSGIGADDESVTRVPGITATLPSRLGFRLNKEVKPGLALTGVLEAGIQMDDGNHRQSGRLFGRQLYAGLKTNAGSFAIGRQYSMILGAMFGVDQLGPNIYSMGSLDSYLPNARYDNAVTWKHKMGNFKTGIAYSFGRDTSGGAPRAGTCAGENGTPPPTGSFDAKGCRGMSVMLRYDAGSFGVAGAIDRLKGGSGSTAYFFNGVTPLDFSTTSDSDTRTTLGGYYKFGATKLSLGLLKRKVDSAVDGTVESDITYVTASHKISPTVKIDGGVYKISNDEHDADATLAAVRGFYTLDKGLDLYAQVGSINNSDNASYQLSVGANMAPAAGQSQTGVMFGMRYIF